MVFKQSFYDSSLLVKVTFAKETTQKALFTITGKKQSLKSNLKICFVTLLCPFQTKVNMIIP